MAKRIILKDIPFFIRVCMKFFFSDQPSLEYPTSIIFVKSECIFMLNFQNEAINVIYTF